MTLVRTYYHCPGCRSGWCPRDRALGLSGGRLSPAVIRMVGAVAALTSFQESSDLLHDLAGLHVGPKHVERSAEALGAEIAEQERRVVEAPVDPPIAQTLYLGLDGTGIPMRSGELLGRAGKQPDGSAKTREVKLCCLWSAQARDANGRPERDLGSVSHSAALESAALADTDPGIAPFAQRVLREAQRRGFDQAQRPVVLGDGAAWIWNLASQHFPRALQILDLFHAQQHLSQAAKAIWGAESQIGQAWIRQRYDELDRGDFDALIQAYTIHAQRCEEARLCADYLKTHRHRMRYPDLRAAGLCIATGVLEPGCRVVVGQRLKRSGMHWTQHGANAILALRCTRLSGRYDDFWQRRNRDARLKVA